MWTDSFFFVDPPAPPGWVDIGLDELRAWDVVIFPVAPRLVTRAWGDRTMLIRLVHWKTPPSLDEVLACEGGTLSIYRLGDLLDFGIRRALRKE